jgi:hypothetical protein
MSYNNQREFDPVREARNAYQRKWRSENPERVRAIQERFYLKQQAQIAADERIKTIHHLTDEFLKLGEYTGLNLSYQRAHEMAVARYEKEHPAQDGGENSGT